MTLPTPDPARPSVISNVRIIGRVLVSGGDDSLIEDSLFEPALRERQPRWLPAGVANWLRRQVTEQAYPAITIEGAPRLDGPGTVVEIG